MAWIKGEQITATKLNSENAAKVADYGCWSGGEPGWASVYSAWRYTHNQTGKIMRLYISGTAYWFAKGTGNLYFRNSSGDVTTHNIWDKVGITNSSRTKIINVEDYGHGVGFYRGYVTVDEGGGDVNSYWGQSDCVQGDYLVHWENPTSGGNRIQGTPLTVAILDSGLVGTVHTL